MVKGTPGSQEQKGSEIMNECRKFKTNEETEMMERTGPTLQVEFLLFVPTREACTKTSKKLQCKTWKVEIMEQRKG